MLQVSDPIRTERLVLRPYRSDDLDGLHDIHSRADVVRYLYSEVRDREASRVALEEKMARDRLEAEGDGLALAVTHAEDGRLLGEVSLRWLSAAHQQGEVGFVFHPDAQGHGYAREAATVILGIAFDDLGLHRVVGRTDARNEASAALMRRLGMRLEAHLRENEVFKGEWGDELVFAMLAKDWQGG